MMLCLPLVTPLSATLAGPLTGRDGGFVLFLVLDTGTPVFLVLDTDTPVFLTF